MDQWTYYGRMELCPTKPQRSEDRSMERELTRILESIIQCVYPKQAIDDRLGTLQRKLEAQGNYTLDHVNCRVIPDLESRQSMLLPPKYPVRSLRRVEGIV